MSIPYQGDSTDPNTDGITGTNSSTGTGVSGFSKDGFGVRGDCTNGLAAVRGQGGKNGVLGYTVSASGDDSGVVGINEGSGNGAGVSGASKGGVGVRGESLQQGLAPEFGLGAPGVYGVNNQQGIGVQGDSNGDFAIGVLGGNTGGTSGTGVQGESAQGFGVVGRSEQGVGVSGHSDQGVGVRAEHAGTGNFALLASKEFAAEFFGDVLVHGRFNVLSVWKGFLIDHPLNPAEKFLAHACVESSEIKNIYDGMSVLDSAGEVDVELPAWFEALNKDFRYQLTAVGGACPNLFVAKEISNNRFRIGGGAPQMKVSWQVTGIRKDAWASANPFNVEVEKSAEEKGLYINPELHNAPKEKSIREARQKRLAPLPLTAKLPPKP